MSRPLVALCLSLVPGLASAASGPPLSPEALAARSDRVVVAHVTRVRTEGEAARVRTFTTLRVLEGWKGEGPLDLEVEQLGGSAGGYQLQVAGDARFEPGEDVVVFLRCRDREAPGRCTLVGLSRGKLKVQKAAEGDGVVVRGPGGAEAMPLGALRARIVGAPGESAVSSPGVSPAPRVLVPRSSAPGVVAPGEGSGR